MQHMRRWWRPSLDLGRRPMSRAQSTPRARISMRSKTVVRELRPRRALDLGTGGGHVVLPDGAVGGGSGRGRSLARHAGGGGGDRARERGSATSRPSRRRRSACPSRTATFDFLGCRYSAHHWRDLDGGLREARRVLEGRRAGRVHRRLRTRVALLDTHLQAIELLRDTSHVRNRTAAEWLDALARAGFSGASMPDLAATHGLSSLDCTHAHAGEQRSRHSGPAAGGCGGDHDALRHRGRTGRSCST